MLTVLVYYVPISRGLNISSLSSACKSIKGLNYGIPPASKSVVNRSTLQTQVKKVGKTEKFSSVSIVYL